MAKNNDSIGKTLLVIFVLCLVCSAIVAGSAVGLKAKQEEQKLLDRQINILKVTGLMRPELTAMEIRALYEKRIEPRLVNLKTGEFTQGDPAKFTLAAALKDPEQSEALPRELDVASVRRISHQNLIYLVRDEQNKVSQVVLPIYGNGLWSVMYAFLAVDSDGNTVNGITYYEQKETPGLGGEIENPNWQKLWVGKQLFDSQGKTAIHVAKGNAKPEDIHGIDGLSGATLTSNGVQRTLNFWLGDNGYGVFLKKMREGALNNG